MTPVCGDGIRQSPEACDDNNLNPGDGCSPTCTIDVGFACNGMPSICTTVCGDGIKAGTEGCDDAPPAENGDGCSATCTVEPNYMCMGSMPSVCIPLPSCMDGVKNGNETDVDCGGTCAPANRCVTGQMCAVGGDCVNAVCTGMSCAAPACGNGIVQTGEACDDNNTGTGDGCTAACTVEPGFACAGSPSLCTTTCGDGIVAGAEACDDAPPAENGDGCSATCTVETGYTCTGSPSVCTACGNGVKDPSEQCDDGNTTSGDGCNAACTFDIGCAAGETQVVTNVTTPLAIPDSPAPGVSSIVNLGTSGAVTKLSIYIASLTHTFDGDLDISLVGPNGVARDVSSDNGSTGDNYRNTQFVDGALTSITAGTSPFSGRFAPEQSLATTAGTDLRNLNAAAPWRLLIVDDTGGDTGTLDAWSLIACVNPAIPYCGNGTTEAGEQCDDGNVSDTDACDNRCRLNGCGDGNIDTGEQCDDSNMTAGDGCSATCQVENPCPAGQTAVTVNGTGMLMIPDAPASGISSPASVTTSGAITRVRVLASFSHAFDSDLDIFLQGPTGVQRELSTDNGGSGDNYLLTLFADSAATSITAGTVPFTGTFRPELSLSTTAGTDFLGLRSAGTWSLLATDDAAGTTGSLDAWTLFLCVDTAATYCGDNVTNGTEQCDDGNVNDIDACDNRCRLNGCGDGNIDTGEQCDDSNMVSGDGCSSTCQVENPCPAGQTPISVNGAGMIAIPDADAGISSAATVTTVGAITRIRVLTNFTHTNDTDLDVFLMGPNGVQRELTTDNGGSGDNYSGTLFTDSAATAIAAGSAPFSGSFRPELSLSTTAGADFLSTRALGTWTLLAADDSATLTGTLDSWTLFACIDPAGPYCGDGTTNPAFEECDDGNTVNTDVCTNTCQLTDGCGDGNLDPGEQCDDDNTRNGDGCSGTCAFEMACGAGQTMSVLTNTTSAAIPDNNSGMQSFINVPTTGLVRQVRALVNVTHALDTHLDLFLRAPHSVQRELSTDNGGGANYVGTMFADDAGVAIISGFSPFSGAFRPEQTLNAGGFANQEAQGAWSLRIGDDTTGTSGTLNSWALAVCIDPIMPTLCGNGAVETGETCDDANVGNGDGCSSTCQVETACGVGETAVVVSSTDVPKLIPDNSVATGVTSTVTVTAAGTVRKVVVVVGTLTHSFTGDVAISLISPMPTTVALATNRGAGGDDFVSTTFDDSAATAISAGVAPFRGSFRPEAVLSGVNGQTAAGTWTLKMTDSANADVGELVSWTLGLCVQ